MKYQPITCVWEVTMGCNMRCGHCGSSCAEPLPDELNTQEALDICEQIAQLGLTWITLSGGEPLTRKDLPKLIKCLSEKGVAVNIITNGWLLKPETADVLKESGISTVAISIDGTQEIHDSIRKKGAFEHARRAFEALKERGINTGAVTTITKQNIDILPALKEELIHMGVDTWQVQIGLPMGNLKEKPDWLLKPEQMTDIIDFCYETAREGRIRIFPADCIGYYTKKEIWTKQISYENSRVSGWDGCNAGIRGFGILQNGDILGCTSIRSREYIEGNLRERSLKDIWEDENSFLWRRNINKDMLKGSCRDCRYGSKCLGGCPNTRLTMNGDIYSENQYCAYNLEMKKLEDRYKEEADTKSLSDFAGRLLGAGEYQEAAQAYKQIVNLEPDNAQAYKAKGYCEYMCGNYEKSAEDNKRAMQENPNDAYAIRGFAISIYRLGRQGEGIGYMRKAVELTGGRDRDLMEDLMLMERGEARI